MRLSRALKEKQMDVRLLDKHVSQGKLPSATLQEYLKSLKNEEGNYEVLNIGQRKYQAEDNSDE